MGACPFILLLVETNNADSNHTSAEELIFRHQLLPW